MTKRPAETEAPPELIARETIFGNPSRISPRFSPDGKRVAYLAPDEGVLNLWVREIGRDDDRPVTKDRDRGVHEFFWAYDNRRLIYAQDRDGDENWHLWSVDLEQPDTARDLTPFLGVQAGALDLHAERPEEMLVLLNLRDRRVRDVHRLDLVTGALTLEVENEGATVGWYTDHQFRVRGRLDADDDGGFALLVRADETTAPWVEVAAWPYDEIGGCLGFTPDGEALYLLDSRGRDTAAVTLLDLASGELTEVASDPEFDVSGAVLQPKTGALQAVIWSKERKESVIIDREIEADWRAARALESGDMSLVSRDLEDRAWIVAFLHDDGPMRYHVYDRATGKSEFLFAHRPELEELPLAPMEPIEFRARDGLKIRGYLTRPVGAPGARVPLVLFPHGGPWVRDTWGFDPTVQWLANRGFAVLQVNYRGSSGFGKSFLHAGDKEWGRKMQHDLTDAAEWAIDRGIAKKSAVAIMGASYGGYAALAGIAFTPELYAAAIDIVGPSSLFTLLSSIPPYWEPLKRKMMRQVGDPEAEADLLEERSPLFHVDRIETPLLIGQGQNDPRVKEQESEQIVRAMRERDKEVIYVLFHDEGHGFVRPENRLQFYGIAEQFLARHLEGRCEPLPEDRHGGSGTIG